MKTITEYQPMIFGELFSLKERRKDRTVWVVRGAAAFLAVLYVLLGLKITTDTGLAVWDWQFWFMFAPLFVGGERLLRSLARRRFVF